MYNYHNFLAVPLCTTCTNGEQNMPHPEMLFATELMFLCPGLAATGQSQTTCATLHTVTKERVSPTTTSSIMGNDFTAEQVDTSNNVGEIINVVKEEIAHLKVYYSVQPSVRFLLLTFRPLCHGSERIARCWLWFLSQPPSLFRRTCTHMCFKLKRQVRVERGGKQSFLFCIR